MGLLRPFSGQINQSIKITGFWGRCLGNFKWYFFFKIRALKKIWVCTPGVPERFNAREFWADSSFPKSEVSKGFWREGVGDQQRPKCSKTCPPELCFPTHKGAQPRKKGAEKRPESMVWEGCPCANPPLSANPFSKPLTKGGVQQHLRRANREVQTVNWEGGGEGAVERGVKSSLKKAHKPWVKGNKGAQTVN